MAGNNKILKPGHILFREGDKSDGMYVIRRGNVQVYLDKGGNEIPLAKMIAGSMIGEMALFDNKPRSASARAVDTVEVTHISNEDFNKILKQIPKWFVTLMANLSGRLRDTNNKLQKLEMQYKGETNLLEQLGRIMHILNLLYYKFGEKEVKSWALERKVAEEQITTILSIPTESVQNILDKLVRGGLLNLSKNRYKADVFVVANRGVTEKLNEFIQGLRSSAPDLQQLPQEIVDMADVMERISQKSAYTSLTITLEDLVSEGENLSFKTDTWRQHTELFKNLDSKCIEVFNKDGLDAFKVNKTLIPKLLQNCKILIGLTSNQKQPSTKVA
ncbi:MAG: Crp/Fnr family transcriptional regulator [Oligoflexus sp.]